MSRPLRLVGYIAIGVLSGLLIAAAAIWLLSRTGWGMERVRGFAVQWIAERVDGEVQVGRISGSGLLGGVIIHDFGIVDSRGRPFLATDSLELNYNIRTLLGGSIVLNDVVLYGPSVVLEQLPGDTLWNFEHVFPDRTPGDDTAPTRRLILFDDARIVGGTATVRFPFETDGPIEPRDTARILVDRLPLGLARVLRFDDIHARLNRVIWESPLEPGRMFDVRSLQTRGFVFRDPIRVEDARGTVTMRDTIIAVDMPEVELPGSAAAILGSVIRREGRNDLDFRVEGRRIAFRDLNWLHPEVPDEGGGSLVLRVQSQPNGTLWLAEDARLSTPGTNVAGSFGVVTGDSLYFTRVDLRASPLDVELIERMLPGGLPVDGLLVGTVEVRGPLSALETSGAMRLAARNGGADSEVSWRGVLDVRNGDVVARSFNADVKHLEMSLVSAFARGVQLDGSVSGSVQGSGRRDGLSFTALLEHAAASGARSVFDGGGTIEGKGRSRRFDLTVTASPVTLQDLALQVPALKGLQGQLSGPVHLDGSADDLGFRAELATPGGPLLVNGRVQGSGGARRIAATADAQGFRPDAFRSGLPPTFMSGRLSIDLRGAAFETMSGPVQLVLDSTRFGELPHSRLLVEARMADGVLVVDSALLRGPLGTGRAHGTLALVAGGAGRLDVGFSTESLTALEPFLYRNRGPAADGEARVTGRVDAVATLTGWLRDLTIEGSATGDDILLGPVSAGRMHAEATATAVGTPGAGFRLVATADSVIAFSHPLQVARLELNGAADSIAVTAGATAGGMDRLFARGAMHRAQGDSGLATTVHLDELRLGSGAPWLLAAPATVRVADGTAALDSIVLERSAGGRAVAAGRLAWAASTTGRGAPVEFVLGVTEIPFADLLGALRSDAPGGGVIDGVLRVSGTALEPFIEAELHAHDLLYHDVRIDRVFAELNYAAKALDVHAEAQYGGRSILAGGGRIPIDLRLAALPERRLDEALRVTIDADSLPPALPLGLLSGFTNVGGRIDGRMTIGGTTLDPTLSGGFAIRSGTADWDVSGVRYGDVTGNFVLEQGRLVRVDVSALSADPRGRTGPFGGSAPVGSGTVKGTLDFTTLSDPAFDLRLSAAGVYAAKRRDVEARVTGEVRLGGRYTRPELSGQLRVDDGALYIEELYRQYLLSGVSLDNPDLLSIVDTSLVAVRPIIAASQNPFLKNLQVDGMEVEVGADSWLRSRDMDVEVRGRLNVAFDRGRRDEDLRLTGSLNVERGTYTLYYPPLQSRRFQVRQGTIDFPGTPGIDPNLAITAAYKARAGGEPLDVLAIVSGTLQSPRVHLSSDVQPPISESDLASYLFFGVPTWEVASAAGGDQNSNGSLSSALTPSVLGYASSGLQTLVQSAGLLDYVGLTTVETDGTERNDAGFSNILAETQLEIGSYLTSDLYLGMSKRLGTSNLDAGARLEWRFLPEYSFELFAEDRLARTPGFGLRQESGLRKVYGFLLFREWGF